MNTHPNFRMLAGILLMCGSGSVGAAPFTDIVIFGDSLSDAGNNHDLFPGISAQSPPYHMGRYSNGPTWIDHLAASLGLPTPVASRLGGKNYAHGGAQTGDGQSTVSPVPNVGVQITEFLDSGGTLTEKTLVVVWAGHNDLFGDIRPEVIAANMSNHIAALHANGAETFVVGNMTETSLVDGTELNTLLTSEVKALRQGLSVSIAALDYAGLHKEIVATPDAFGITTTTTSSGTPIPACRDCGVGATPNARDIVQNPEQYMFWDDAHPSATFHEIIGNAAFDRLMAELQPLQAGDSDMDLDFDQFDLVQVQVAAKYLTGEPTTWGEGDWNGAPGGYPGSPPDGDGLFDQKDIVAALQSNTYLTGSYAAIRQGGVEDDERTSIIYNARTGEIAVDAPASTELMSINIDSAAGIFTEDPPKNIGGTYCDYDPARNIFKATFGGSFSSVSFGNVAQPGLSETFVVNDLTVVGSLAGGGDLGAVDLIYVPEPSTLLLALIATVGLLHWRR